MTTYKGKKIRILRNIEYFLTYLLHKKPLIKDTKKELYKTKRRINDFLSIYPRIKFLEKYCKNYNKDCNVCMTIKECKELLNSFNKFSNMYKKYKLKNIDLMEDNKRIMILKKPEWIKHEYKIEKTFLHELSHVYFHEKFKNKFILFLLLITCIPHYIWNPFQTHI